MAQVKVYGVKERLIPVRERLSATIHECVVDARKKLIRLLFDRIRDDIGIAHQDLEICIHESPAHNWGFRGMHGDEVRLNYKIDV